MWIGWRESFAAWREAKKAGCNSIDWKSLPEGPLDQGQLIYLIHQLWAPDYLKALLEQSKAELVDAKNEVKHAQRRVEYMQSLLQDARSRREEHRFTGATSFETFDFDDAMAWLYRMKPKK